jgi:hypothetical protein
MRLSGSQLAVPTAIVVIMVGAAEMHAAEAPVSSQEIRAKIDYWAPRTMTIFSSD